MFCSMILYERLHKLKLPELRSKLNEKDDFSEEMRAKIAQFTDL